MIFFYFRNRNGNTLRCGDDPSTNNPTPTTNARQNGKVNHIKSNISTFLVYPTLVGNVYLTFKIKTKFDDIFKYL